MHSHFQSLLRYERAMTQAVAASLRSIPPTSHARPEFPKALSIFAHTQQATYIWLSRIGGIPQRPFVMFPDWSIDQSLADAALTHDAWQRFLDPLTQADLNRTIDYTSTEGILYRNTLGECLTHVFNHATYHRGQIALLVTTLSGQCATTDFIAWSRIKL